MKPESKKQQGLKGWVVFSSEADIAWLKILKPGFRHCAVLLNDGKNWITVDPLSNFLEVDVHELPLDFNLPQWLREQGHIVIQAPLQRSNRPAPWGFFSCVEAVKRVLGIHKQLILTPWQLYCHLNKIQNRKIFNSKGDLSWEV